ncbi:MAG: effector-associated domain EAD1-containing protein [Caldilineaceae bacterium]
MNWTPELTKLRTVLAMLYSDETSARRIAIQAGLNETMIKWNDQPTNNWQAVLTEAQNQSKVAALAAVALEEYGDNASLRAAAAPFYDVTGLPPLSFVSAETRLDANKGTKISQLNREKRRQLIDLLLKLPNISDGEVRSVLLATLPVGLQQSIPLVRTAAIDIPRLVDTVSGEAWSPLPDGVYPITVVIENAIDLVPGSRLADELQTFLNTLRS